MNRPIREGFVGDPGDEVDRDIIQLGGQNEGATHAAPEAKAKPKGPEAPPPFNPDEPPADVEWPQVFKLLYKPTRNTKNEIIHELRLRAPTAKDIRACGVPVRITHDNDVVTDPDAMIQMIAALADCYPPFIEALDGRDYTSIAFYMQRFFLPNSGSWPTPSSTRTD
jgi:hypothetical protein